VYGTSWCGYCTKMKEDLGDSVTMIRYVDCDKEEEKCAKQKIQGLPTLILRNGTRIVGYRSLEWLAEEAGCEW